MATCSSSIRRGVQVLLDRRRTATEADVGTVGRRERLVERGLDAVGDEVERGAALHLDRRARVVGEHEHRMVVRGIVAPPPVPVVAPRPAPPRPRTGPNMLRPMTVAPIPANPAATAASSTPVEPPGSPIISRPVRVSKTHSCSRGPPTPSGCSRSWSGPATYPSRDMAMAWTRSFGIVPLGRQRLGRQRLGRQRLGRQRLVDNGLVDNGLVDDGSPERRSRHHDLDVAQAEIVR